MKRRPRKHTPIRRKRRRTGRPSARRRRHHASTRTVRLGNHVFRLSLVQRARVSEIKPKRKKGR